MGNMIKGVNMTERKKWIGKKIRGKINGKNSDEN